MKIRHSHHHTGTVFGVFMFLILFYSVGASLGDPVLSRFAEGLAGNTFLIGILVSLSWITYTILSEPAGSIVDRIGEKKTLIFGGVLDSLGYFLIFLSNSIFVFAFAMILEGMGSAFFWSSTRTHIAKVSEKKTGKAFGLYTASWSLGWSFGPIIGGFLAILFDLRLPFLISSIVMLLTVFVFSRSIKDVNKSVGKAIRYEMHGGFLKDGIHFLKNAEKGVKRILLSHLLLNCSVTMIFVFIPLYLFQLNHAEVGYIFFIYSLIFAFSSIFWGYMTDRFGRHSFSVVGFLVSGILVVFFLGISNFLFAFILTAFLGLTFSIVEPTLIAMLNDRISPKQRGTANGISIASFALGGSIGSIAGGYTASIGFGNLFILAALICFVGGGICLSLKK